MRFAIYDYLEPRYIIIYFAPDANEYYKRKLLSDPNIQWYRYYRLKCVLPRNVCTLIECAKCKEEACPSKMARYKGSWYCFRCRYTDDDDELPPYVDQTTWAESFWDHFKNIMIPASLGAYIGWSAYSLFKGAALPYDP